MKGQKDTDQNTNQYASQYGRHPEPSSSIAFKIQETKRLPHLLGQIPDPPEKLYICGNAELLEDKSLTFLCVIGSRKYTTYGHEACTSLIRALRGLPVAIVSGLALGIDSIAHEAALEFGLPCIAVPGSGLHPDVLYPRTHLSLAEEILKTGGTLLSEYEPRFRASPWSFPMRNRIMAGLSHAILIIEGEEDSGTLITARLGLDYNRDVFAVPGSIFSTASKGPLGLIRRGATPICSGDNLIDALGFKKDQLFEDRGRADEAYSRCSEEELRVIRALASPQSHDDLQRLSGIAAGKLQVILALLEIRGLITEEYGQVRLSYLSK